MADAHRPGVIGASANVRDRLVARDGPNPGIHGAAANAAAAAAAAGAGAPSAAGVPAAGLLPAVPPVPVPVVLPADVVVAAAPATSGRRHPSPTARSRMPAPTAGRARLRHRSAPDEAHRPTAAQRRTLRSGPRRLDDSCRRDLHDSWGRLGLPELRPLGDRQDDSGLVAPRRRDWAPSECRDRGDRAGAGATRGHVSRDGRVRPRLGEHEPLGRHRACGRPSHPRYRSCGDETNKALRRCRCASRRPRPTRSHGGSRTRPPEQCIRGSRSRHRARRWPVAAAR